VSLAYPYHMFNKVLHTSPVTFPLVGGFCSNVSVDMDWLDYVGRSSPIRFRCRLYSLVPRPPKEERGRLVQTAMQKPIRAL
jgi:hypothetical protein